jgi:hypothetical protein
MIMIMVWTGRVRPVTPSRRAIVMLKKQKNLSGDSTSRKPWVDPDDAPEITDEWLDRVWDSAEIRHGDSIIRRGRPPLGVGQGAAPKPRKT